MKHYCMVTVPCSSEQAAGALKGSLIACLALLLKWNCLSLLCKCYWWKIPFSVFESHKQRGDKVLVSWWGATCKTADVHQS